MTKHLFLIAALSFCAAAQSVSPPWLGNQIRFVASDPVGDCSATYITQNTATGALTGCVAGSWTVIDGGDGANPLGYYLVSRASEAPANAVNLGALTTGLLKITVSGSVATPSTAAAGTDYANSGQNLSYFAATTSAQLAGVVSDETGSGALVFATSPTLVTPALGTPSAAILTNATGLPVASGISGFGTGVATFLATPSSANLAAAVTDETGSGLAVFGTAPTLTGPIVGTTVFASLGTPANGTMKYCSDCTVASGIDNTCSGSGTGAMAFRINGAFKCLQ